ncbi:hypothetical protein STEG23_025173 [Scotinomys teguina]
MTTKNVFSASKPLVYVLQTSLEATKATNKSSKTNKPKGSFLNTQDSVRNLSKQSPGNCEDYLPEAKNVYCPDLCPLAAGKFLAPELQIHVPIPEATEIYIPENSTARLQLMYQTSGFRKNINPALCPLRHMKTPSSDAMRVPSIAVVKTPSADVIKVPSIAVVKTPSADVMKVPSLAVVKTPSADAMKVTSVPVMKPPSADAMRVSSMAVVKTPSADVIKVPSIAVVKPPSADVIKVPSIAVVKPPSADVIKVPSIAVVKPPSVDVMKVPSTAVVNTPPSVASKQPSAWVMKPRTKNQLKNQKKQDKENHFLSLDLVLVNPNWSTPATQHLPVPEATKVTISGTHVVY